MAEASSLVSVCAIYSLSFVCYLLFRNESSKEWSINIIVKSWFYNV